MIESRRPSFQAIGRENLIPAAQRQVFEKGHEFDRWRNQEKIGFLLYGFVDPVAPIPCAGILRS
jgi:hypothetical protein